jgi:hypothetical protein
MRIFLFITTICLSLNLYNQSITSVNPDSGYLGEKLTITIVGSGVDFTQGSNLVTLEKIGSSLSPSSYAIINSTTLNVLYLFSVNDPAGIYNVKFNSIVKTNGFKLLSDPTPPSLVSISPVSATQGQTLTIRINAHNTHFSQIGAPGTNAVYISKAGNNIYAVSVTVINDTTVDAPFKLSYSNAAGLYAVNLGNPLDGTISLSNSFNIIAGTNPPYITSVSPEMGHQNQIISVTITGANVDFMQGSSLSTSVSLTKGINTLSPTSYKSITKSTIVAEFALFNIYPIGFYNVNVINSFSNLSIAKVEGFYLDGPNSIYTDFEKPIEIYPNPSNGLFYYSKEQKPFESISVVDIQGKIVKEYSKINIDGTIDLTGLPQGIYFIQFYNKDSVKSKTVIIK